MDTFQSASSFICNDQDQTLFICLHPIAVCSAATTASKQQSSFDLCPVKNPEWASTCVG